MELAEKQGVGFDVAMSRCVQFGDEWKVPSRDELSRFTPPFEGKPDRRYWLDGPEPTSLLRTWTHCRGFDCKQEFERVAVDPSPTAFLVCFKGS